jgi:hypothetical protein
MGSTILERTLAASHTTGFLILFRRVVGLLWKSDQPVTETSTYIGQHNTETQRQTSMTQAGLEPMIPATKRPRPTYDLDRAVTGASSA